MKLIDSMTEQAFREKLLNSRRALMSGDSHLSKILRAHFPDLRSAMTLNWTPEQCEDIFTVLIDDQQVATVELTRQGDEVQFAVEPLVEYQRTLKSRIDKIRLAVALDIYSKSPRPAP